MMSFNVGGRYIDMPSNFDLHFLKRNPLFAFDDLECERTTNFRVPKTPNNMDIFGFSNDYHRYGMSMRKRVSAQLQNGIVVKDGYLYVSQFSENEFECIFVTGELLFLRDLREAGLISQFVDSELICAIDSPIVDPPSSPSFEAARVRYKTDGYINPSWLLTYIAQEVVTNSGTSVDFGSILSLIEGYRIISGSRFGVPPTQLNLNRIFLNYPTENPTHPIENDLYILGNDTLGGIIYTDSSALVQMVTNSWENPILLYGYFKQWVTRQKITIKFADDTSPNIFLAEASTGGIGFLGGYSFSKNSDGSVNYSGVPLAGREIVLDVGQKFMLITIDDLHSLAEQPSAISGWSISTNSISCNVTITGADEQPTNASIRVRDNLPEITAAELLKIISALTGTLLSIKDGKVVFVDDATSGAINNVVDINVFNLTRKFVNYAQVNIIDFDSDEELNPQKKVSINYKIVNDNIDLEKKLFTIPLNEGDTEIENDESVLYVRGDYDGYTLGVGKYGSFMHRVELPINDSLKHILDVSTSVELRCRMYLEDFEKLHAENLIYYDGAIWVWTQAKWNGGVADLSLSKI